MSEQSIRRSDELLTELVEQVETARTLPMSSSCVLPRERVLDLLDELREVMPPEIDEARKVIANRDGLLHDAYGEANAYRDKVSAEADAILGDARHSAEQLVHDAEVRAYDILESASVEHTALVSATEIHQAAAKAAAEMREQAESYLREIRALADEYYSRVCAEADGHDAEVRAEAERYATRLTADSEDYADHTLAELAATLHRSAATAEQGRAALANRRGRNLVPDEVENPSISA